jgi:N-acetylglucosamine-6-phosphate deacetylase
MLGPLEVEVSEGVARLVEGGSIAGSTLTLDRAFKRAVTVDRLPVEGVVAAISANPARLLGMSDRIGSLEPGKDADLVLLDPELRVIATVAEGSLVHGGEHLLRRPTPTQAPTHSGRAPPR